MVELMIAIAVLMVAVLGTFSTQLCSHNLVRTTHETDSGVADLQAAMEQILLLQPELIPIPSSPFRAGQPITAFNDLHLRDERIVPTYPGYVVGNPVPDPLPIILTLSWNDFAGRARSLTLSCTRTK